MPGINLNDINQIRQLYKDMLENKNCGVFKDNKDNIVFGHIDSDRDMILERHQEDGGLEVIVFHKG